MARTALGFSFSEAVGSLGSHASTFMASAAIRVYKGDAQKMQCSEDPADQSPCVMTILDSTLNSNIRHDVPVHIP